MSFSMKVKEELKEIKRSKQENAAVLWGMILLGATEKDGRNYFVTSVETIARYFCFLLRKVLNITLDLSEVKREKKYFYFDITAPEYQFDIKSEVLENKKLGSHFLSGAFIARGSVNDPETGTYHYELSCDGATEATYVQRIINGFNSAEIEFNAKLVKRRDKLVVYIKEMSKILDLLRLMDAVTVAFEYEEFSILRQIKSEEKRKVNWEIANDHKQMLASREQNKIINYLYCNYPLEKLDPTFLLIMKIRREQPFLSIRDISEYIKKEYETEVSKAWVSRRFQKLKEIAIEHYRSHQEAHKSFEEAMKKYDDFEKDVRL